MAGKLAVMASSPADYQRLGLSPTSIAPWEDGARTDGSAGTCEWWYFDAHLADGAKLVVAFMNKDLADPQKPLSPLLRLELNFRTGGTSRSSCTIRRVSGRRPGTTPMCAWAATGSLVTCTATGSRRPRRRSPWTSP